MSSPSFKIGDTIKVVSRLYDGDTPVDISTKTIRSVLKRLDVEIVGVVQLLDNFTSLTLFSTSTITEAQIGKYQTDIRFTENGESFATPTVIVDIGVKIS